MGARWSGGTSSRRICSRRPCRRTAFPSAARTFRTQAMFSPSIDTRYRCPSTNASTTGREMTCPDLRPVTSNVTSQREATREEATARQARFRNLASRLGRCPWYIHRVKSPRAIAASHSRCCWARQGIHGGQRRHSTSPCKNWSVSGDGSMSRTHQCRDRPQGRELWVRRRTGWFGASSTTRSIPS